MVRAILDGRKTQTRRVIKPQPPLDRFGNLDCGRILGPEMYHPAKIDKHGEMYPGEPVFGVYDDNGEWGAKCSYGRPGDLLWVRETWAWYDGMGNECPHILYRADNTIIPADVRKERLEIAAAWQDAAMMDYRLEDRWRPSIHMPKWISRITLEVTAVRDERLQDISEEDAKAEGVTPSLVGFDLDHLKYRAGFQMLWDSINAKRGYDWNSNPWVWVTETEPIKAS